MSLESPHVFFIAVNQDKIKKQISNNDIKITDNLQLIFEFDLTISPLPLRYNDLSWNFNKLKDFWIHY